MPNLKAIYSSRFRSTGLEKRQRVWNVLCDRFFDRIVDGADKTVLDLACGYGEFINAINAKHKIGVDLNPDTRDFSEPGGVLLPNPGDRPHRRAKEFGRRRFHIELSRTSSDKSGLR